MESNIEKLKSIANKKNTKLKGCNILDPHIRHPLTYYISFKKGSLDIKIFISNGDNNKIDIEGFETVNLFSINIKDKICIMNNKILGIPSDLPPIYTPEHQNQQLVLNWLKRTENHDSIKFLVANHNDSLIVYKNAIVYYRFGLGDINKILENLIGIVNGIEKAEPKQFLQFNKDMLPYELQPLLPFMKEWAISDDFVREEKIMALSMKEKKELLRIASPYLKEINGYISKFKEPIPNEVIALDNLANVLTQLKNNID